MVNLPAPSAVMTWSNEMWSNVGTQVNSCRNSGQVCRNWGTVLSELGYSMSELGYSPVGTRVMSELRWQGLSELRYLLNRVCRNSGLVSKPYKSNLRFDDRSIYLRTIIIYLLHNAQVPLQDWRFKMESEFQLFRKQPLSYPLQMMLYTMLNLHL